MAKRESQKKWIRANRDKISKDNKNHKAGLKRRAFEKLGNRCSSPDCHWINDDGTTGCNDVRCLQIDHIKGDGSEERKQGRNTQHFYYSILGGADGYQLLCANCNWIKRVREGEFKGGKPEGIFERLMEPQRNFDVVINPRPKVHAIQDAMS